MQKILNGENAQSWIKGYYNIPLARLDSTLLDYMSDQTHRVRERVTDEFENEAISSNGHGQVQNERIVETLLLVELREQQAGKDEYLKCIPEMFIGDSLWGWTERESLATLFGGQQNQKEMVCLNIF